MKLINAGLGRTGTTSLKGALDRLGFGPVYHTTDLFTSPKDLDLWEGAMEGEEVDWRAFFAGYEVADWPVGLFYKDIIRAHPEAKVMLSVRDPEGWFESINGTLKQMQSFNLPIPQVRRVKRFLNVYAIEGLFEGKVDDKAFMVDFFERHTQGVKDFVGEENLLVYGVKEGWVPLCDFLEVEAPDEPFPRLNQRGGIRELAAKMFGSPKRGVVSSEL